MKNILQIQDYFSGTTINTCIDFFFQLADIHIIDVTVNGEYCPVLFLLNGYIHRYSPAPVLSTERSPVFLTRLLYFIVGGVDIQNMIYVCQFQKLHGLTVGINYPELMAFLFQTLMSIDKKTDC